MKVSNIIKLIENLDDSEELTVFKLMEIAPELKPLIESFRKYVADSSVTNITNIGQKPEFTKEEIVNVISKYVAKGGKLHGLDR